jgi:hypothetical protein
MALIEATRPLAWFWQEFNTRRSRAWLVGVMAAGLAVRLWLAWQPVPVLLEKNLPDDAYYYFMVAHHTVQSGSASLDGVHVTNGFHPLWWLLLMPVFAGPQPLGDGPVHLALTLGALAEGVSMWAVGQVAARLTRRADLGVLAAGVYAANPTVIFQATNGLETALAMALLTLFWWVYVLWLHRPAERGLALGLGTLGGLMFLARSDSLFFLGLALLGMLWHGGPRAHWRAAALAGGVAGGLALPWFVWSRLTVGTWLQESGVAVPYAVYARFAEAHGTGLAARLAETWRQLTYAPLWLRGDVAGLPFIVGVGLWAVALAVLAWRWRQRDRRLEMAALLPLLGAGALLVLAHAGARWYPRPWYFIPTAAAFAVCAALAGETLMLSRRVLFALGLLGLAYFGFSGAVFWQVGFYPWQREMGAATAWIASNTPPGATVGSFNAGIYAYYSGRTVVNLDGVVNHDAFEAVRARRMLPYLQAAGVDYLVDYDLAIRREYALFMGPGYPEALEEVGIISEEHPALGYLRAYRILPPPTLP